MNELQEYYIRLMYNDGEYEIIQLLSYPHCLENEIDYYSRYTNYEWEEVNEEDYLDYIELKASFN